MAAIEVLPEVTKFIEGSPQMLIGGTRTGAHTGQTFEVYDPSTGKPFTEVPRGDMSDVDAAVKAAREAHDDRRWSGLRPGKRTDILFKLGDLIKRNLQELSQLESIDAGKPVKISSGEVWLAG